MTISIAVLGAFSLNMIYGRRAEALNTLRWICGILKGVREEVEPTEITNENYNLKGNILRPTFERHVKVLMMEIISAGIISQGDKKAGSFTFKELKNLHDWVVKDSLDSIFTYAGSANDAQKSRALYFHKANVPVGNGMCLRTHRRNPC